MDKTGTGNFKNLNQLINGNTKYIKLDYDVIMDEEEKKIFPEGIEITEDDFTLNGNGHTIDAQKLTRIFKVNAQNVMIENITLQNGYSSENGGCIFNTGKLILNNVTLQNNTTQSKKGILHAEIASGGAIHNEKGTVEISDSRLLDNTAQSEGGAISNWNGTLKIINSNLLKNKTDKNSSHGGGISSYGRLTINNSIFEENFSEYGGAICYGYSDININDCKFIKNSSKKDGGALSGYIYYNHPIENVDYDSGLNCINCEFIGNHSDMKGGVLWSNHSNTFSNCSFIDNFADEEGNIVYFDSIGDFSVNIQESLIKNDSAKNSDVFIENRSFVNINDTIIDNSSDNIFVDNVNGILDLSNIKFNKNYKAIRNNFMVLIDDESMKNFIDSTENATVKNKNDTSNSSKNFNYLEDLINDSDSNVITLDYDIVLNYNEKNQFKEGIIINRDNLTIDGQNHVINAKKLSRIFQVIGKNVTFRNIKFKNGCFYGKFNEVKEGGGAIEVLPNATLNIEDCEFTDNHSRNIAGCISNRGVTDISNTLFKDNSAQKICGTIFNVNQLQLSDCEFIDNFAPVDIDYKDNYYKTRSNILNEGVMTLDNCNFNKSQLYKIERAKIALYSLEKYLSLSGALIVTVTILGWILSELTYTLIPSSVEWQVPITIALGIGMSYFILALLLTIILLAISNYFDRYIEKQGFDYCSFIS